MKKLIDFLGDVSLLGGVLALFAAVGVGTQFVQLTRSLDAAHLRPAELQAYNPLMSVLLARTVIALLVGVSMIILAMTVPRQKSLTPRLSRAKRLRREASFRRLEDHEPYDIIITN